MSLRGVKRRSNLTKGVISRGLRFLPLVEMPVLSMIEGTEPSLYFRYCETAFVIPNESEES